MYWLKGILSNVLDQTGLATCLGSNALAERDFVTLPWVTEILLYALPERDFVTCLAQRDLVTYPGSANMSHAMDQRSCHMPQLKGILSQALDQRDLVTCPGSEILSQGSCHMP